MRSNGNYYSTERNYSRKPEPRYFDHAIRYKGLLSRNSIRQ